MAKSRERERERERERAGVWAQLYHYENIGNEPFEEASDPMNIGIPKNLIYFFKKESTYH